MRNGLLTPTIILFIAWICMGTECNRNEISYTYNFLEKVDIVPAQKIYKLGDTIWLKYSNPNKRLYDQNSSKSITVDTIGIPFFIAVGPVLNYPKDSVNTICRFITDNGATVMDGYNYQQFYGCNNTNDFTFKIGIIP